MAEPARKSEHIDWANYYATKNDVVQNSSDLKDAIRFLDSKVDANKNELKQDIMNLRSELKEDIHTLDKKIDSVKSELKDIIYSQSNKLLTSIIVLTLIPVLLQIFSKKLGLV